MKKSLKVLLAMGLSLSLLAGCGGTAASKQGNASGDAPKQETGKKVMVIGDTTFNPENGEPDVNPHNEYSGWPCIRYGIGETLVRYNDSMEVEPWLAKSWENTDPTTWKITLQDNVTFTSGRAMDAEAVKECFQHLIDKHDRAPADLQIESMEADGQVLTIKTKEANPALLNYLGDPYSCIVDVKAGFEGGVPAGTGPYLSKECKSGDHITLVKNDKYWNGSPKLDELTIRTITDGNTLALALQGGEIDAAYGMAYESYPLFAGDQYQFSGSATSRAFYVTMNYDSPLIADPAVRKAIAMGIDKEGFVKSLLSGHGKPAKGAFPDNFPFGGAGLKAAKYDLEAAKAVLEEAGWKDSDGDGIREKDGKKLEINWLTYPSRQELPLLAESAQSTLKTIGIQVNVNSTADHNTILEDAKAWDVYASSMVTAPTGDPEYFFTSCCLDGAPKNRGKYHNDKVEEMAKQLLAEFDPAKRAELAVNMQQELLDDNGFVFASFLEMNYISKAKVIGYTSHPCDYYQVSADLDIK